MRRMLLLIALSLLALALLGAALLPSYTVDGGVIDDAPLQGGGYELRGGARP